MTTIFILANYNWLPATLLKENRTTYKVTYTYSGCIPETINIKKEKCAFPNEEVCVVWERWKGVNGRGGYRVERYLYPQERVAAMNISRQHIGDRGGLGAGRVEE